MKLSHKFHTLGAEIEDTASARYHAKDALLSLPGAIRPTEGSVPALSSDAYERATGKKKSINPDTLADYRRRILSKLETYKLNRGISIHTPQEDLDPVDFTLWLMAGKKEIVSATWRVYRCALQYYLQEWHHENTEKAQQIIMGDIHNRLHGRTEGTKTRSRRDGVSKTSAKSPKRLPFRDYEALINYLRKRSRSYLAAYTADFLSASLLTALRPDEWKMTEVCFTQPQHGQGMIENRSGRPGKVWLLVMNAKATNNRANGIVRTLDLSSFSDAQIDLIHRVSSKGREQQERGLFTDFKKRLANTLEYAVKVLWTKSAQDTARKSGKNYSLYCARHQAIANWKVSGLTETEISAMAGHGNTETAESNYGRRAVGWSGGKRYPLPKGVPEEIALVEKRISYYQAMEISRKRKHSPIAPAPGI
ncbi:hypothetical protein AD930_11015 [Acetobacter malorum]|nr:hypothetical protein AD930_11015 [Acetobacter malorum]